MSTGLLDILAEASQSKQFGLKTGYRWLDDLTGGLVRGRLYILAAQPEVGKTTFAINLAHSVTQQTDEPVVFFSGEMPSTDIAVHYLSVASRKSPDECRAMLDNPMSVLPYQANLHISDEPASPTFDQVKEFCVALPDHPALVVIDHLGTVGGYDHVSAVERANKAARDAKILSMELSCPVVALHHLNRMDEEGNYDYGDRPISKGRLKYGGEGSADVVVGLYRREMNPKLDASAMAAARNGMWTNLAKNRYGEKGEHEGQRLRWCKPSLRIEDLDA